MELSGTVRPWGDFGGPGRLTLAKLERHLVEEESHVQE